MSKPDKKRIKWKRLGRNVLAVAKEGDDDKWAAYIDSVPDLKLTIVVKQVLEHGDKLHYHIARAIFPSFRDLRWRP